MKIWRPDGTIADINPDDVVINDLTNAPIVEGYPEGDYYVPAIIPAEGGLMRIVKLRRNVLLTKPDFVPLGETSLQFTAGLAIGAASRTISKSGLTGVKADDKLLAFLKPGVSLPTGYQVGTSAVAKAAETVEFSVSHPALVLGASFNIPVLLYAVR